VQGRDGNRLKRVAELDPGIRLVIDEHEFAYSHGQYDVILVGSPPFLHLRHIELAASLGMPVICEKPLIVHRKELPRLLELIGQGRVTLTVAHHVRHQPAVTDIVNLLRSNRLGSPVSAGLRWCFMMNHQAPSAQWKLDPALGGSSAMFDCGVHAIDLAVLFFGQPDRVGAVAHRVRSAHVYDSVASILDYPGFAVSIIASQSAVANGNDLQITFSSSVLRAENLLSEKAVRAVEILGGAAAGTAVYEPIDLYRLEVENFCHSLEGSASIGTSAADALMTTRILFAMEDALRIGQFVDLQRASRLAPRVL
jgi:predicted dehydrogenase